MLEAYHALDCGSEIVSIASPRPAAAEDSDERALGFVRRELGDLYIERTEGSAARSSHRAMATLLSQIHALIKFGGGGARPAPPPPAVPFRVIAVGSAQGPAGHQAIAAWAATYLPRAAR